MTKSRNGHDFNVQPYPQNNLYENILFVFSTYIFRNFSRKSSEQKILVCFPKFSFDSVVVLSTFSPYLYTIFCRSKCRQIVHFVLLGSLIAFLLCASGSKLVRRIKICAERNFRTGKLTNRQTRSTHHLLKARSLLRISTIMLSKFFRIYSRRPRLSARQSDVGII